MPTPFRWVLVIANDQPASWPELADLSAASREPTTIKTSYPKGKPQMSQCKATNRQGNRCGRSAVPGATVCNMHGGKAPQVQAKAAERVLEAQATAYVERFGGRTDIDPPTALLELVQTKRAEVGYWSDRLATTDTQTLSASPELALLHKAQDQLASYSVGSLRAGLNHSTTPIPEAAAQQARILFEIMQATFNHLGLSPDQRQQGLQFLADQLAAALDTDPEDE